MRLCVGRQSMRLQQVPSPSFLLSADSAAAADAAVLESAAPMADVGGPVVVPTGPAVGPAPASREIFFDGTRGGGKADASAYCGPLLRPPGPEIGLPDITPP